MLEVLRTWRNDPKIYNWCRQVGLIEQANQKKWFDKIQEDQSIQMFSVLGKAVSGDEEVETLLGVAGLCSINTIHGHAEISLYLYPDLKYKKGERQLLFKPAPGSSLAAIKTLARYAFDDLRLNRIWGDTFEENRVEVLNLSTLGFVCEGTLRESYFKQGKFINSVIQSMLRSDYKKVKESWK
jgi:hypothetical protein